MAEGGIRGEARERLLRSQNYQKPHDQAEPHDISEFQTGIRASGRVSETMAELLASRRAAARESEEAALDDTTLGKFHSSHLGSLPYALDANSIIERRLQDLISAMAGPGGAKVKGLVPDALYDEYKRAKSALTRSCGKRAARREVAALLGTRERWRMQAGSGGAQCFSAVEGENHTADAEWTDSEEEAEGAEEATGEDAISRAVYRNLSSPDRKELRLLLSTSPDSSPEREVSVMLGAPQLQRRRSSGQRTTCEASKCWNSPRNPLNALRESGGQSLTFPIQEVSSSLQRLGAAELERLVYTQTGEARAASSSALVGEANLRKQPFLSDSGRERQEALGRDYQICNSHSPRRVCLPAREPKMTHAGAAVLAAIQDVCMRFPFV